eukprot:4633547-Amphidinium_carterae.1
MACATLRFAHFQRSTLDLHATDDNVIQGYCKKGKAKVADTRPGFAWFLSRCGITKVDLSPDALDIKA